MLKLKIVPLFITSVLIGLCFLKSEPITAADRSNVQRERRDGNWWQNRSGSEKLEYLVGFFDGMKLGRNFAAGGADTKKNCDIACFNNYSDNSEKYLRNVTAGQVRDGLEEFYKDFRNRGILISDAAWVVLKQIASEPQREINRLIESLRNPPKPPIK